MTDQWWLVKKRWMLAIAFEVQNQTALAIMRIHWISFRHSASLIHWLGVDIKLLLPHTGEQLMTEPKGLNTYLMLNDQPERSDWKCYMFGNRPGGQGFIYFPVKGQVPNRFVRFMMKVCFDCLWVKEDNWPLPQPSQHSLHGVLFYCIILL
jgi:hypothetical protein